MHVQKVVVALAESCGWLENRGSQGAEEAARGLVWLSLAIAALMICFYIWSFWKSTCGWEEVYVCVVECEWAWTTPFLLKDDPSDLHNPPQ